MAWLGTWAKRRKFTISNTNVDTDETHFPLPIFLGATVGTGNADVTDIFDDLGSNSLKIAVTDSTGNTEMKVEVHEWDTGTEYAVLWVSRSDWVLDADAPTDIYLYWDAAKADNTTNVGVKESTPGTAVWDSNFEMVVHMDEATDATVKDSTSNNNDGTPTSSPASTSGKIVKGLDFSAGDYLSFAADANIDPGDDQPLTIEAWVNPDDITTPDWPVVFVYGNYDFSFGLSQQTGTDGLIEVWENDTSDYQGNTAITVASGWRHIAIVRTSSTNINFYLDGQSDGNATVGGVTDTGQSFKIGQESGYGSPQAQFYGLIEEVRYSSSARSAGWIKACYYAQDDNIGAWGSTEFLAGDDLSTSNPTAIQSANPDAGDINVVMLRFQVDSSNDDDGDCVLNSITIDDLGTVGTGDISNLKVYIDTDTDQAGSTQIGNDASWDGNSVIVTLNQGTVGDRTVSFGTSKYIFVVYDLDAGSGTETIKARVTAVGVASPDSGVSGLTYDSNLLTVQVIDETDLFLRSDVEKGETSPDTDLRLRVYGPEAAARRIFVVS